MLDIYCFGDSITYGDGDSLRGGWAERLKTLCVRRSLKAGAVADCVFNLGIPGESTAGLVRRLAAELDARLDANNRAIVLFAYGTNDAAETDGVFSVPIEAYAANLSLAIDTARKRRCEAALLGIAPIAAAAEGVPNVHRERRRNSDVAAYNEALKELARRKSTPLLDVHDRFMRSGPEELLAPDGLHPNAAGHALICASAKALLFRPSGRRRGP